MNTYRVDIARNMGGDMVTHSHTVTVQADTEAEAVATAQAEAGDGFTAMWATEDVRIIAHPPVWPNYIDNPQH